jgi:alpha-tubulin suppressor-like RCC1 family protein
VPVAVNTASGISALCGKTVVAIAAGDAHSLALCSDGTVTAWGNNTHGQLGDNTTTDRYVPGAVNTASGVSALFGKTVVTIAAGVSHSVALCADGTVVAWGGNYFGQLGDNTTTDRYVPVAVNTAGSALAGKTVVAIAAGGYHTLALCSDGTVAAWGANPYGQLGDNTTTERHVPVAVSTASGVSALFSKTVVAIAAGGYHGVALCGDGTVTAWGYNSNGQLGNITTTQRNAPVAVNTISGVSALFGKTVVTIAAGGGHSVALCSDGTLAAWGRNDHGELGDTTTTQHNAPVPVNSTPLGTGERFARVFSGSGADHTLALVAVPPPIPEINVTGNGANIANGDTTPSLADHTDFGRVLVGGGSVTRTFTIQNAGTVALNLPGAPKVVVSGANAGDFAVTSQPNSPVASGVGTTAFQVSFASGEIGLRAATINIANDDSDKNPYTFAIQGTGSSSTTLAAAYSTGNEVPLTTEALTAPGGSVNFTLNYAPTPGTELMVVRNTGPDFINGTFDNLAQGQTVALSYGGTTYNYVANYYGGSGNDLVLVWANSRLFAWGNNRSGQLGDTTTTQRQLPMPMTATGVLAGKTVVAIAAGAAHNLALCSDGTLAAWGANGYGQLGDNTAASRSVPAAVNTASGVSALFGKRVIAVAAGYYHSLALCSDGTVAAWGYNYYGQLGDNTRTSSAVPVAVNASSGVSALCGKRVVAIAAGFESSFALCSDGAVVAWGRNFQCNLGDHSVRDRLAPVAVNADSGVSALFGKKVVAIAAGDRHGLALCSDGILAGWGWNQCGQVGDNTPAIRIAPVVVDAASGISALFGKTVVTIAAGSFSSVALCSDGSVATWGYNAFGELGDNTTTQRNTPVAVNTASGVSALFGKTVVAVAAGGSHSLALCSDGTLAAWGRNYYGQVGDNTTTDRCAPVAVNSSLLAPGERFARVFAGSCAGHTLALVAVPPAPEINVSGNGINIASGDTTPNTADYTDFGSVLLGGATVTRTFGIENTGTAPLNLSGTAKVVVSGANAVDFTVTLQPSSPVASGGGTTTFQVTFTPSDPGLRTATLSIANDDSDENPYTFAIQGTVPPPPVLSSLTPAEGAAGGGAFTLTINGTGFQQGATVKWNGSPRPTTVASSTQVTATINASDLVPGVTVATAIVTLANGDGQGSNPLVFSIVAPSVGPVQGAVVAPGGTATVSTAPAAAGAAGVSATVQNNGGPPVTVVAATYDTKPVGDTVFRIDSGSFMDVQITGADDADVATVLFYYPSTITGARENNLQLRYFDGVNWILVESSRVLPSGELSPTPVYPVKDTTDNLEGTVSGGRFTVVFDNTSTPKITELNGTIFGMFDDSPQIGSMTGPPGPVALGTTVTIAAQYATLGNPAAAAITFLWNDSTQTNVLATADGLVSACKRYAGPGVYAVTIRVTDENGKMAETQFGYVVVYDPDGGFVTGGGWINSPAGAYMPGLEDTAGVVGKATFGFVAKYKKGATVPDGNTEFQFKAGNLNFKSTSYQWLVVAGARAQFKGVGTVNGQGPYAFMLTAIDGDVKGGGGQDRFRIKIWNEASDTKIYDNQHGGDDTAGLEGDGTLVQGGSIVIQK